jgi:DNA-binding MltR family transcriptional regulator
MITLQTHHALSQEMRVRIVDIANRQICPITLLISTYQANAPDNHMFSEQINMKSLPLDIEHPDVKKMTTLIFSELLTESDRGAVIMGADILDSHLKLKLEHVMTSNTVSASTQKKMLNFNGVLGTLSAKIDALYAFGLITKQQHDSANALRKIRNNAAHSNESFKMSGNKDLLQNMCNFGASNVPSLINVLSQAYLLDMVTLNALHAEAGEDALFENEEEVKQYLSTEPAALDRIRENIPRIEFAYALLLLCGTITTH